MSALGRTIFALSSGWGKCGVAIVRVSGSQSRAVLSAIAGEACLSKPRLAQLKTLRDPQSKEILDKAIIIWFPGPRSYTGEDTCEFQVHGGLAVVSGVLKALGNFPGLFPADPGEFSKRAFFNGSMDLTEAEGVADLIHAETEMQRKQALLQMGGSLHSLYDKWRQTLLQSLAHFEAYIDFSEDENIEDDVMEVVNKSLHKLLIEIETHLADGYRGQRLRDGVQATIVGQPNVGKSSLLNLLCEKPAAIVSAIAGTTRDVVEQHINIGGYPLSLADTAGLRGESSISDLIEKEGISRARTFVHSADIVLLVIDAHYFLSSSGWEVKKEKEVFEKFVEKHLVQLGLDDTLPSMPLIEKRQNATLPATAGVQSIVILSKIDLIQDEKLKKALEDLQNHYLNIVLLSCLTKEGVLCLHHRLKESLETLCGNPCGESPALSQVRHRQHLLDCLEYLQNYFKKTRIHISAAEPQSEDHCQSSDLAVMAEDLRKAIYHLGKITGNVTTEQILDVIFRDFCIGK